MGASPGSWRGRDIATSSRILGEGGSVDIQPEDFGQRRGYLEQTHLGQGATRARAQVKLPHVKSM